MAEMLVKGNCPIMDYCTKRDEGVELEPVVRLLSQPEFTALFRECNLRRLELVGPRKSFGGWADPKDRRVRMTISNHWWRLWNWTLLLCHELAHVMAPAGVKHVQQDGVFYEWQDCVVSVAGDVGVIADDTVSRFREYTREAIRRGRAPQNLWKCWQDNPANVRFSGLGGDVRCPY